ncbi:MAG: hypothetical protein K0R50_1554 [Eubacterium sp.]|jgi:hypothetical protein|nr:hypothetical protein [Eubacterium sp.]
MPVARGEQGRNMGATNSRLRREIEEDILDEMVDINDYLVTRDSILLSENFHLDARDIGNDNHKVDIQYRTGSRQTVSVVVLSNNAENIGDLKTGLRNSLSDGYIYNVT